MSAPNFAKTKRGRNGKFLPSHGYLPADKFRGPSSLAFLAPALRSYASRPPFPFATSEFKKNQPEFWQSFPKKIVLRNFVTSRKAPHCPNAWRAEHQEKCPFLFKKNLRHRQIKKARNIFLWCSARVKRGSGGADSFHQDLCWKKFGFHSEGTSEDFLILI